MSEEELPIWKLDNPRGNDIVLYRNGVLVTSTRGMATAYFKANSEDTLEVFDLLGTDFSGKRVKMELPFLKGQVCDLAELYRN